MLFLVGSSSVTGWAYPSNTGLWGLLTIRNRSARVPRMSEVWIPRGFYASEMSSPSCHLADILLTVSLWGTANLNSELIDSIMFLPLAFCS